MSDTSHKSPTHAGRMRAAVAVTLASVGLSAGCGGDEASPLAAATFGDEPGSAATTPAYGLVTPSVAAGLVVDRDVVVIDARTPEEFAEGHIDGAVLLDFNSPAFAGAVAELDTDGSYLVYCRSGNRSGQAVALMRQLGFERLWDLDGGVNAWTAHGLSLVH